ncbi:hypothetical protein MPTK1_3g10680 [Marchantia polymorpha subsp. ruderalis]|uniref:Glycosyl hydrolase-like 10 domain-containing protein n=2 Tax=Marchantia polymorpha TaxID=3197 RepID=A0AAF6AZG0_MARPO|nr:hypothetical protein MARPO_0037s0128 [Marchantia polymorpha]BBN05144.1 hypothetical protein Mp_3g10680 [Marchantia polymorpha subsp. ruderalis]|eukprot:PTQ40960.1 hypothetical protein MARPO_0037s0128 [Marchantia polymorpha]
MAEAEKIAIETGPEHSAGSHGRALLCPYEFEDPAFRRAGRLPNLRYGDQVRAVWVTRYDFESDVDIINIMQRSAQSGFNTVFFQVRGNATTYYRSKLEPWSETFEWQSPGYDPLSLAIQEAHARNMSLHAWINVMPMWRGSSPPTNKDHMYWSHPEWSWYDKHGERQPLNRGFYVSLNPCLPEARNHIVKVCREIVACYEVDGLHLDYIRFPNEPPVVNGQAYPHDKRTLELFQSNTGFTVEERPNLWDQWRSDCVTALVRDVCRTAKSIRPQIVLTAAVGAERLNALSHFQDVETWWKERLLDAVVPMNYTGCHRTFRRRVEREWLVKTKEHLILPITRMFFRQEFWPDNHKRHGPAQLVSDDSRVGWSRPPEPAIVMGTSVEFGDSRLLQKQLALALQRFGHFSVFSYASLFDQRTDGERLQPLLVFLRILADASEISVRNLGIPIVHPFRDRNTHAHPEEAGPYDQIQISQQFGFNAPVVALQPAVLIWRSRRKGKRFNTGEDGNKKISYRRTGRRRLLVKDRNRRGMSEEKHDSYESNLNSLLERGTESEESNGLLVANNWEVVRMSEATMREEEENNPFTAGHGLMKDLRGGSSFRRSEAGMFAPPVSPLCTVSASHILSHSCKFHLEGPVTDLSTKAGIVLKNIGKAVWSRLERSKL